MLVALTILGGWMAVMPGPSVHAEPSGPAVRPSLISPENPPAPVRLATLAPTGAGPMRPALEIAASASPRPVPGLRPVSGLRPVPRPAALAAAASRLPASRLPASRPMARDPYLPAARWDGRDGAGLWTRGLMAALRGPAAGLAETVPGDIAEWCPAYAANPPRLRRAFWVGVMSALSRFESRHRADAVGGGGLYHGLLQILPGTARGHGCVARDGATLRDPVRNLSCAARIMARTVQRDNAVALSGGRRAGIAADWGPMTKPAMRAEMAAWTREQSYCRAAPPSRVPRPVARPA